MHSDNWDDLRFVLAVADEGSVSAAARRLKVNHATVLRRVAAYEARIGSQIFERTGQGYVVPADHTRVIDAAREVAAAIAAMDRVAQGVEARLSGVLRITSTDTFCQTLLPSVVAALEAEGDDLQVEVHSTNAHLDLARMEADITIRPALALPDTLLGEQVGMLGFAAYGPKGRAQKRWLSLRGALERSKPAEALASSGVDMGRHGADSFIALREMAAVGLGNALLPCLLAEGDARLKRLALPQFDLSVPIWVASHADIGSTARLRAFRDIIAQALLPHRQAMAGPVSPE